MFNEGIKFVSSLLAHKSLLPPMRSKASHRTLDMIYSYCNKLHTVHCSSLQFSTVDAAQPSEVFLMEIINDGGEDQDSV